MNHLFSYFLALVTALLFILVGIGGIVFYWSVSIQTMMITFALDNAKVIFGIGGVLLFIGMLILINAIFQAKKRYYYVQSKNNSVAVDKALIEDLVNTYWKRSFPHQNLTSSVVVKRNKIHITAHLPHVLVSQRDGLLTKSGNELKQLFADVLDYQQTFYLAATFQKET